jgi:cytochrome c-type biogenesis protein
MDALFITTAFIAGIVSFLAPCVLPIIPGYLAYIAGSPAAGSQNRRRDVFVNSIFFVLGFSFIFALFGVLLQTVLVNVGQDVQLWASRIGGIVVIFFGLYLVGLLNIGFLERTYSFSITRDTSRPRYFTSFLFGVAFAAGWTPCAGAVLGGILGLASTAPFSAFLLLFVYALGLGVPFLLVGYFTGQASNLIARYSNAVKFINLVFGIVLIGLGILVFTQDITLIGNFDFINKVLLSNFAKEL